MAAIVIIQAYEGRSFRPYTVTIDDGGDRELVKAASTIAEIIAAIGAIDCTIDFIDCSEQFESQVRRRLAEREIATVDQALDYLAADGFTTSQIMRQGGDTYRRIYRVAPFFDAWCRDDAAVIKLAQQRVAKAARMASGAEPAAGYALVRDTFYADEGPPARTGLSGPYPTRAMADMQAFPWNTDGYIESHWSVVPVDSMAEFHALTPASVRPKMRRVVRPPWRGPFYTYATLQERARVLAEHPSGFCEDGGRFDCLRRGSAYPRATARSFTHPAAWESVASDADLLAAGDPDYLAHAADLAHVESLDEYAGYNCPGCGRRDVYGECGCRNR